MKLAFEADLPHQRAAIEAVLDAVQASPRQPAAVPGPGGMPLVANADPDADCEAIAVEMETGTGKTYVFVRTALELARQRGLLKFVIVVPTVAIREGVLKTLQVTRDHLRALYPDVPYRFFAYERARIDRLVPFVRSTTVDFMVLTIDAFNKASNVLRQPADRFGGAAPLDVLAACRPVLVLDEPHHLESPLSVASLADLRPSLVLRYGATLGRAGADVVHRLTPAQAHARGLVKTIEVVPCEVPQPIEARFSAQIRATIAAHLRRQRSLRPRGIKVLSLFFIDRVARYTDDDGLVRRLFDEHFAALASDDPDFAGRSPSAVRAAYFAATRKRCIDSSTGRTAADAAAYELIMRDKERLLSLDEPVAFLFSHSALREGWDNPNVMQICTLAQSVSAVKKRQEIGRGIRLCVDHQGRRVLDRDVNVLQVFANASYEEYVAGLQDDAIAPPERAPMPARAGDPSRPRVAGEAPAVPRWPHVVDVDRLARAVVDAIPALPFGHAIEVDPARLLDLLEERLHRDAPPCPLSRRTLAAILRALPNPASVSADAPAGAFVLARAIRRALAM